MKSGQKRMMATWAKKRGIKVFGKQEFAHWMKNSEKRNTLHGGFSECTVVEKDGELLVLKSFRGNFYRGIMKELRGLVRAAGPGVQELYAVCPDEHVIVSKYAGDTMSSFIRQGLSRYESAYILEKVLKTTHRILTNADLCHNDLKPSNICVADIKHKEPTVTIIDFGLSCRVGSRLGYIGQFVNEWMAPELMWGARCSHATDIYSLGYVGKRLSTNSRVFSPCVRRWIVNCRNCNPNTRPHLEQGIAFAEHYRKALQIRK